MSTRKPPIDPKKALTGLKKLGLFKKGKGAINGRKTLTDSQKRRIRKAYDEYSYILNTPKTEFVVKNIAHYDKSDKDALKRHGYKIINDKLYLDKQGSPSVTIKRKHIENLDALGKGKKKYGTMLEIERKLKNGSRVETEYISEQENLLGWRENLLLQYQNGGFKDGDFIGMKIGRGGVFRRSMMLSLGDVYKYLEEDFSPKDMGSDKEELLENTILIKFQTSSYRNLAEPMQSKKEKGKVSRARSKKAAVVKKSKNTLKGVASPKRKK